jgi:hypothetical protein
VNLTLSVDEKVLARARRAARAMNKSVNQPVREYLDQLAGQADVEDDIRELRRLSADEDSRSRGWRFDRDELHERS